MHSVHFCGSITNVPFASEIATFGHSGSQAEQLVHCDATIFKAIGCSCYLGLSGLSFYKLGALLLMPR